MPPSTAISSPVMLHRGSSAPFVAPASGRRTCSERDKPTPPIRWPAAPPPFQLGRARECHMRSFRRRAATGHGSSPPQPALPGQVSPKAMLETGHPRRLPEADVTARDPQRTLSRGRPNFRSPSHCRKMCAAIASADPNWPISKLSFLPFPAGKGDLKRPQTRCAKVFGPRSAFGFTKRLCVHPYPFRACPKGVNLAHANEVNEMRIRPWT